MAVSVFCARLPRSITGNWASARPAKQRPTRSRLRLRCLCIGLSFLDRHTPAMHELLFTTINAAKRAGLPLGHIHTATALQAHNAPDGPEYIVYRFPPRRECHLAGSDSW